MVETNSNGAQKKIPYESLTTVEAENLSEACMNTIEGRREAEGMRARMAKFFREICCCGDPFGVDMSVNESVFSAMKYLEEKGWDAEGIFVRPRSEEDMNNCIKLLELNESIDYEAAHPEDVAMGFRVYVEENLKDIIPCNVRRKAIDAYKNNDEETKQTIICRMPFVLSDQYRLFLKMLKRMFLAIEANSKRDVDMEEIYGIFGPVVVRRPPGLADTDSGVLREILKDLLAADLDEFPMSFYSY